MNGSLPFGSCGPLDDALDGPAGGGAGPVACTWVWSGEAEASTGAEPLLPPLGPHASAAAAWFLVVRAVAPLLSGQLGLAGHLLENGFDDLVVEAVVHPFQESLLRIIDLEIVNSSLAGQCPHHWYLISPWTVMAGLDFTMAFPLSSQLQDHVGERARLSTTAACSSSSCGFESRYMGRPSPEIRLSDT